MSTSSGTRVCRERREICSVSATKIHFYILVSEWNFGHKFTPLSTHGNLRSDYLFKMSLKFHKTSKSRRIIVSWDYLFTYYPSGISLSIYIYEELTVSHDEIVTNMIIDVMLIQIVLCALPIYILGKGRNGPFMCVCVCMLKIRGKYIQR